MPDLNKAILDKHPSLLYYNDPECQLPVIRQITVFGICEDNHQNGAKRSCREGVSP